MSKVSVIIPVYNTEKYLPKCLDSICNQTLKDIEIVCVNDCSTDGSLAILQEYAKNDNRIKLINFTKNKGAAAARNAGIDAAIGEYIGFVDSDDFVDLDFYEKLYVKAQETAADIVKSNLMIEEADETHKFSVYDNLQKVRENKLNFTHIPTSISLLQFINGNKIRFNETLKNAEDCVFEVMMSYYANKIEIEDATIYHYRFNQTSLNNTPFYSFEKIKNLALSLDNIVDFLNGVEIAENDYKEVVLSRSSSTIKVFQEKYDGTLNTLRTFRKLMSVVEDKLKFGLKFQDQETLPLLEKICHSREENKTEQKELLIPKKIFYVWFGGKKPNQVHMCIQNWREKLPDFEIVEINEKSPYFDFEHEYKTCKWFKDVYDRKLWAFVSDYARVKVLSEQGGVYLDTDVTIHQDITPLLKNRFFIGEERHGVISVGIFGAVPNHPYLQDILSFYQHKIYESPLYTIPTIFTEVYKSGNYDDVVIYPIRYFYPFYYNEEFSPQCLTKDTYTIHWWGASWINSTNLNFLKNKHLFSQLRKRVSL